MKNSQVFGLFRTVLVLIAVTADPPPFAAAKDGAPTPKRDDVPVRKVVLFSSGVGYFEHTGHVAGEAAIELRFKTEQINDLLKSLVLEDLDGGTVSSAVYPSQDPISKTLKSFQVDISANPALGELLNQLRGAEVSLSLHGQQIEGTILGLETKQINIGDNDKMVTVWLLNLLAGGSIRAIQLDDVQMLTLKDEALQSELNQALAALTQARDQDKKPVAINFAGQGQRRVRLAYVVETPVWKTSYRLIMPGSHDPKAKLQGWAIVENQTDSDWQNVQLSLVSGRPISFTQDLYQPLYVQRPVVVPELYASLRPKAYESGYPEDLPITYSTSSLGTVNDAAGSFAGEEMKMIPQRAAKGRAAGAAGGGGSAFGGGAAAPLNAAASVAAIASARELGELFEYAIGDVTLPRQRSAMLPIMTDDVEVERVSIYDRNVLAKHPLNGARLKNSTGKHLLQGPITVFDDAAYAGDAQIDNLPPDQERLLSYAIDLQVGVDAVPELSTNEVVSGKIVRGTLELHRKFEHKQEYNFKNNSAKDKTLVVEHPRKAGYELVDSPKPRETTEQVYRFQDKVPAGKGWKLVVKQELVKSETLVILGTDAGPLLAYTTTGSIPQKVRDALKKVIDMKSVLVDLTRQLEEAKKKIAEITKEQERLRSNMSTVDKNSEYYTRLLKKLNDQETEIETQQTKIADLQRAHDRQRKELEDYVSNLSMG